MSDLSIMIDRLVLSGMPPTDHERFVALLVPALQQALAGRLAEVDLERMAGPEGGADPAELRATVAETVRRVVFGLATDKAAGAQPE